jgi:hypothetical protein
MALADPVRISPHLALHHDELILYVLLVYLRLDLPGIELFFYTFVSVVLCPILLKVNITILHDVELLHFIMVGVILLLLVFDEVCSLEEVVLHPVLQNVKSKRDYNHDPDKLDEWVAIED